MRWRAAGGGFFVWRCKAEGGGKKPAQDVAGTRSRACAARSSLGQTKSIGSRWGWLSQNTSGNDDIRIPASASPPTRQHRSVHPLPPCLRHRIRGPRTSMEIGPAAVPLLGGSSGRASCRPKAQTPTRSCRANRASRPRRRTPSRLRIVWGEAFVSFRAGLHQDLRRGSAAGGAG